MKRILLAFIAIAFSVSAEAQIKSPQASPFSKVEQKIGLSDFTLEYSRPGVKGREIFGAMIPFGEVWRTGANSNTIISFSTDIKFGDVAVKKGKYSLYSIPNKDSWELILYSDTENWGNPKTWDEAKVVARAKAEVGDIPFLVETFTIDFNGIHDNGFNLELLWEKSYVALPISVDTDSAVLASIEKTMSGPTARDYFTSAVYYLNSGKDIKQAKEWIDKAVKMSEKEPQYWVLRQQSLIHHKAGSKKSAIKAAEQSLELAKKAGNKDYVKMNENSLKEWK